MKTLLALALLSMPVMGQKVGDWNIVTAPAVCGRDYACPEFFTPTDAEQLADWIEEQHREWKLAHSSFKEQVIRSVNGRLVMSINGGKEMYFPEGIPTLIEIINNQEKRIRELERISKEFEKEANDALDIADKCINRLDNAKRILKK